MIIIYDETGVCGVSHLNATHKTPLTEISLAFVFVVWGWGEGSILYWVVLGVGILELAFCPEFEYQMMYLHLLPTPFCLKFPEFNRGSGFAAAKVTYCTSLHVKFML